MSYWLGYHLTLYVNVTLKGACLSSKLVGCCSLVDTFAYII